VVGGLCGVLAAVTTTVSWVAVIGLLSGGAGVAVLIRRRILARAAAHRVALIREALPAVADLLALSVTAGESFVGALERVTARGAGPLSAELRLVVNDVHAGVPLVDALTRMSHSLSIVELTRTCDHVIAALDRGTPLSDTLRVQAHEARAELARRMQERAATREVAMLVPLIFVILPVTIAFAVYPGLVVIQAGF
jgi:tight adherence protein C